MTLRRGKSIQMSSNYAPDGGKRGEEVTRWSWTPSFKVRDIIITAAIQSDSKCIQLLHVRRISSSKVPDGSSCCRRFCLGYKTERKEGKKVVLERRLSVNKGVASLLNIHSFNSSAVVPPPLSSSITSECLLLVFSSYPAR